MGLVIVSTSSLCLCVRACEQEVQRLSQLPCLSSVSLSDPHFGDCPLVQADGYWSFMLCYLKRVRHSMPCMRTGARRASCSSGAGRGASPGTMRGPVLGLQGKTGAPLLISCLVASVERVSLLSKQSRCVSGR